MSEIKKFDAIDAQSIEHMLIEFYKRAREDDLIGPIFTQKIGTSDEDWAPHMERVNKYWRSVLMRENSYEGGLMRKHFAIPNMEKAHFKRWMEIFMQTVQDVFEVSQSIDITITAQGIMKSVMHNYIKVKEQRALL